MTVFDELREIRKEPVNVIFGTDWWTDCDDIAALRLLLRAHREGLIRLLGIGINSVMEYSAPSVSAFCEYDGLCIPIGVDKNAAREGKGCRYQRLLAEYPHSVQSNDDCPEAWKLYRRLISGAESKVDIIDTGFPQIIAQLLKSGPDEFSPLSGTELVKENVGHIWLMAGKWDVQGGIEYNLSAYPECAEAGDHICGNCPVPITFLGHEVGVDVITGVNVPEDDPLRRAFVAHGSAAGRCSWDPLTALAAVINDEARAGYGTVRGFATVAPITGRNYFRRDPAGPHCYVTETHSGQWYADRIEPLLTI